MAVQPTQTNKQKVHAVEPLLRQFNRYFQFIHLFVVLLVLLIGSLFLYNFYVTNVVVARDSITQKNASVTQQQSRLQDVKQLQLDYTSLASEAQVIVDALPAAPDQSSIYAQIGGIANRQGLVLQSVNLSDLVPAEATANTVVETTITLTMEGNDYTKVKAFITDLENSLRLFDVEAINFDPRSPTFTVIVKTYYKREG